MENRGISSQDSNDSHDATDVACMDLSRSQNPKPPENNFVDFEVDSFVNEPCRVAGRGLEDSPLAANSPPLNDEDTPPQAYRLHRLTFEQRPSDDVLPTTSVRTGNHAMEMDFDNFIRDLQSEYAEQDMYSNLGRRQPNGLLFNQNNQPNVNNMGVGNLMAEMSSLIAAMQPPGPAPAQQEQLQRIAKPYLVVATFLILGAVARLILQISSYNFVSAPFYGGSIRCLKK
ncbi:unnamed protein product [Nesidiocoris tenuis]|uniref:Uncharacterized protein n=1 Tax=Nesidiocoris tenuis TaxID=355587 RepID=A0A6H5GYW2_9HEMI|nr:unnamed protein product [Nesidiocoris tenuis]